MNCIDVKLVLDRDFLAKGRRIYGSEAQNHLDGCVSCQHYSDQLSDIYYTYQNDDMITPPHAYLVRLNREILDRESGARVFWKKPGFLVGTSLVFVLVLVLGIWRFSLLTPEFQNITPLAQKKSTILVKNKITKVTPELKKSLTEKQKNQIDISQEETHASQKKSKGFDAFNAQDNDAFSTISAKLAKKDALKDIDGDIKTQIKTNENSKEALIVNNFSPTKNDDDADDRGDDGDDGGDSGGSDTAQITAPTQLLIWQDKKNTQSKTTVADLAQVETNTMTPLEMALLVAKEEVKQESKNLVQEEKQFMLLEDEIDMGCSMSEEIETFSVSFITDLGDGDFILASNSQVMMPQDQNPPYQLLSVAVAQQYLNYYGAQTPLTGVVGPYLGAASLLGSGGSGSITGSSGGLGTTPTGATLSGSGQSTSSVSVDLASIIQELTGSAGMPLQNSTEIISVSSMAGINQGLSSLSSSESSLPVKPYHLNYCADPSSLPSSASSASKLSFTGLE